MPSSFLFFLCIYLYPFLKNRSSNSFKINKNSIYFRKYPTKIKNAKSKSSSLFAKIAKDNFEIIQKKLESIGIFDKDVEESFIKGSGNGGQKINKTNNCVMLSFKPNNIVIRCQKYRCLQKNRIRAREILYDKITSIREKEKKKKIDLIEKEKRKILKLTEKEKNESVRYKKRKSQIKKDRQQVLKYDEI